MTDWPVSVERCSSLIRVNDGEDWAFPHAIHPYRIEIVAGEIRPRVVAKLDAAERLRQELRRPAYRPRPLCIGSARSDAYQPAERTWRLTRGLLEVLGEARLPLGICTRSSGVLRDLDLLAELAGQQPVFLQWRLAATWLTAPPQASPAGRSTLELLRRLARAGLWVGLRLDVGADDGHARTARDIAGDPALTGIDGHPGDSPEHLAAAATVAAIDRAMQDNTLSHWLAAARDAGAVALCWPRNNLPEASRLALAEQVQAAGLVHTLPSLTAVAQAAVDGFVRPGPPQGFEAPRQPRLF